MSAADWVLVGGAVWVLVLVLTARVFFALGREAERQDAIVAAVFAASVVDREAAMDEDTVPV